jgi:NAD(P)H-dependent FMN reductase
MKIEIIAGSPRQKSLSKRVALHLLHSPYLSHHQVGLIALDEIHFPFIQNVWSNAEAAPPDLKPIAERFFNADAFILVSPEYNGAYSPALKNAFDHFPKQAHVPMAIATSSPGIMGGMRASQQLLQLVPALFGIASPHLLIVPEVDKKFNEAGELIQPEFESKVKMFCTEFLWLAEKIVP